MTTIGQDASHLFRLQNLNARIRITQGSMLDFMLNDVRSVQIAKGVWRPGFVQFLFGPGSACNRECVDVSFRIHCTQKLAPVIPICSALSLDHSEVKLSDIVTNKVQLALSLWIDWLAIIQVILPLIHCLTECWRHIDLCSMLVHASQGRHGVPFIRRLNKGLEMVSHRRKGITVRIILDFSAGKFDDVISVYVQSGGFQIECHIHRSGVLVQHLCTEYCPGCVFDKLRALQATLAPIRSKAGQEHVLARPRPLQRCTQIFGIERAISVNFGRQFG